MANEIRNLAVLTGDNDGPGMNAAIRSAVRMALHQGWAVWGVRRGIEGLLRGDLVALDSRSVSHIIEVGGTFLGTSSCRMLDEPGVLQSAVASLRARGIEALVIIGGRAGMALAHSLDEAGVPTVGVPASIENELLGTDVAIGVDTALNTAMESLDRIQDTALAQQQAFVVEVGGERSGYLPLMAGIAGGAEVTCIAEAPMTLEQIARQVAVAQARGKGHCVIVVAEGATPDAHAIHAHLSERQEEIGFTVYLTVLGRVQRGGPPTAKDRFLATRLGAAAVRALAEGRRDVMVGLEGESPVQTPLAEALARRRPLDPAYLELAAILAQ
jgi:6-phosphofructokinase 1